jgi:hypothetical protein
VDLEHLIGAQNARLFQRLDFELLRFRTLFASQTEAMVTKIDTSVKTHGLPLRST